MGGNDKESMRYLSNPRLLAARNAQATTLGAISSAQQGSLELQTLEKGGEREDFLVRRGENKVDISFVKHFILHLFIF